MLKKIKIQPAQIAKFAKSFVVEFLILLKFFILLAILSVFSLVDLLYGILSIIPGLKNIKKKRKSFFRKRILDAIDVVKEGEMTGRDIIFLATKHLKVKKARTAITVGGMTIGFGSIIFLLSLGYGFERLVISQVTSLGEMKQVDLSIGQASSLSFSDETMQKILQVEAVEEALPIISSVARVSYQNSVSDVVAYGVTTRFLTESAIQPIKGEIFENEFYSAEEFIRKNQEADATTELDNVVGEVAGASIKVNATVSLGQENATLKYAIYPQVWKAVYDSPSTKAKIIGYTKRQAGEQQAKEVWGQVYEADTNVELVQDLSGKEYSSWIFDGFPLWERTNCSMQEADCLDGQYKILKTGGRQVIENAYITEDQVTLERFNIVSVNNPVFVEGENFGKVEVIINNDNWYQLYSQPKKSAEMLLRFTKAVQLPTTIEAELVIGEMYYGEYGMMAENSSGRKLGYWIKAEWPVWGKVDCGEGCEEYYLTERDDDKQQEKITAFIKAEDVELLNLPARLTRGKVLGESTVAGEEETANNTASISGVLNASSSAVIGQIDGNGEADIESLLAEFSEDEDLDLVEIISQIEAVNRIEKIIMPFQSSAKKSVLVNRSMLTLLGIDENEALGESFNATLVFDGKLFNQSESLVESDEVMMTIAGVLPDDKTPAFYLPFSDVKGTGISNYSQAKIIIGDQDKLAQSRQEIETMGFRTSSVVDTVERINNLFKNLRLGLLIFGLVALSVAALGMFNTLTVSLLEKTREVGLMKAIGMKSQEVKMLFLAESVIMGFLGGVLGLIFGFLAGQVLSLVLTSIAVSNGFDPIVATHIPLNLALVITVSSFLIGVATGFYPAYRATRISALNALRMNKNSYG